LLQRHDTKATIFLVANYIGGNIYLTRDQIVEMDASGLVSFQSHTVTHPDLTTRNAARQREEYAKSAEVIAEITGKTPVALAYPYGSHNDTVESIASEFYQFLLTTHHGYWREFDDPLHIPRVRINRDTSLRAFIAHLG
jgi:peptidoglycan/xylan/chitin deacetylase (PgdA/CDA1 family)